MWPQTLYHLLGVDCVLILNCEHWTLCTHFDGPISGVAYHPPVGICMLCCLLFVSLWYEIQWEFNVPKILVDLSSLTNDSSWVRFGHQNPVSLLHISNLHTFWLMLSHSAHHLSVFLKWTFCGHFKTESGFFSLSHFEFWGKMKHFGMFWSSMNTLVEARFLTEHVPSNGARQPFLELANWWRFLNHFGTVHDVPIYFWPNKSFLSNQHPISKLQPPTNVWAIT